MSLPPSPWTTAGRAIVAADGTVVALANPRNIQVPPQGVPGSFDSKVLALLATAPDMLLLLESISARCATDMRTWEKANALIARARGDG